MTDATIYWYAKPTTESRFGRLVGELAEHGLALRRAENGLARTIDSVGRGHDMTVAELTRQVAEVGQGTATVSFQWWLQADTDVYCRVRAVAEGMVCQEFSLDGLNAAERSTVSRALWTAVWGHRGETIAWILDERGSLAELPLDEHVMTRLASLRSTWEVLVVTGTA